MYIKRTMILVLILLYSVLASSGAEQEQRVLTAIDVPQVFALSAGRNLLIRVDSNETPDIRKQLILHTDVGTFPNGATSIQLKLDNNGTADSEIWLGELASVPTQPRHIWVTAGERILARQEVKLLIPQALQILQYTAHKRGGAQGTIRALVTDQFQNGLRGVSCLLRYTLPGDTPKALTATSDGDGILLFQLPDGQQAGTAYFQLFTETLISKQLAVEYSPASELDRKSLAAVIAIPPTINLLVTNTIPILVSVYSRGEEKVPASVMLSVDVAGDGFAFVPSGTSVQEVPLIDGMGKALLRVPRYDMGRVLHLGAFVYAQGADGNKVTRFIGFAEIREQNESHVTALVKPNQTSGTLVVTVRDDKQEPLADTPVTLNYSLPDIGRTFDILTTDHNGTCEYPLSKATKDWTACLQVSCGSYSTTMFVEFDENGRPAQWGNTFVEGLLKAKQQFIYNADGTITVTDK